MTSPENPLSDLSPEDLQLQPSTAERLVVLVAAYGLDPRVAAAGDPETTEAFLYPGMTPLLGNVLDGLKAASIEELHELSHEAFDEGFDDYRGRAPGGTATFRRPERSRYPLRVSKQAPSDTGLTICRLRGRR